MISFEALKKILKIKFLIIFFDQPEGEEFDLIINLYLNNLDKIAQ